MASAIAVRRAAKAAEEVAALLAGAGSGSAGGLRDPLSPTNATPREVASLVSRLAVTLPAYTS